MARDYLQKLKDDLITQFKEQPNTTAIIKAVAEQLQDVYDVFEQLKLERSLNAAIGAQLDGIGDIVVMSRAEAAALAGLGSPENMSDDLYRKYLKYKIFLNTSNGTYRDVLRGLKMFVEGIPLYYSEDPAHPATMFFDTPDLSEDDIEYVFAAPIARAAGVQVVLRAKTRTPLSRKLNIRTLEQFKWTRKTPAPWVRPGDFCNLRVTQLAQFKKTFTSPQSFANFGLGRSLNVTALTQFKQTLNAPPKFVRFASEINVRTFGQFKVSLDNVPQYQE